MLTGFDLCRAAMAAPGVTGPERSVLLVLAIMASNETAQCYPPITGPTGLTTKCVLSERAVQRAISRLVELKHISRRQLRYRVIYTVHPDLPTTSTNVDEDEGAAATPATGTPVSETPATLTGATQAARPVSVAPKLPVTPKLTPSGAGASERGRRIDHDWRPTKPLPEKIAKIVNGWPPGREEDVLDEFRDFWRADAGKRATKLDWDLTWHNRLRAEIERDRTKGSRQHGKRADHQPRYRDPLLERDFRAGRLHTVVG